jgi:hypothetical protein
MYFLSAANGNTVTARIWALDQHFQQCHRNCQTKYENLHPHRIVPVMTCYFINLGSGGGGVLAVHSGAPDMAEGVAGRVLMDWGCSL